jgi:hypothetical protein
MFRYLGGIAQMEGAFVIIPHNGAVEGLPENLRRVPCEVLSPNGRRNSEFAERGARGYWMLIWAPPD